MMNGIIVIKGRYIPIRTTNGYLRNYEGASYPEIPGNRTVRNYMYPLWNTYTISCYDIVDT